MSDRSKPSLLKRGQRVYIKFGACRYGVVTADERDFYVKFALDTDDPSAPDFGQRVARRGEVSPIAAPAPLTTSLGEFLKGRS
jgi:hypothetical protein